MFVNVTISLADGDETPTQSPTDLLTALGGDPSKDSISVSVSASHTPPQPAPELGPLPAPEA